MYPHAVHVRFLEQAIVSSMQKVEREVVAAVAQDASSNKEGAADAEVPCFRQEGKRADVAEATDPQRKTSST